MISRRTLLAGLGGSALPLVTGCAARRTASRPAPPMEAHRPTGLDAVIDISHNVAVTDFDFVRRNSNILAVIHKTSEGGDWLDPLYSTRRAQAEAAGLLWGAYHFGTRQYSGVDQAAAFLAAAQPGPATVMALDFEPNMRNPGNTMDLAQAEDFVQTIHRSTGRLPLLYTHPAWANGEAYGRTRISLGEAVSPHSILARCDLWLTDYRDEPEVPLAWRGRGWRLWQYAGDESVEDSAYGTASRGVAGIDRCDRNLFAGDRIALYRFWNAAAA